jgi:hypothetical protein
MEARVGEMLEVGLDRKIGVDLAVEAEEVDLPLAAAAATVVAEVVLGLLIRLAVAADRLIAGPIN